MSQAPLFPSCHINGAPSEPPAAALFATPATGRPARVATAIVYCEANFSGLDGKTANGLVRHSERYAIRSVIDSEKAGLDAGMVLDGKPNGIPICRDLGEALARAGDLPEYFIFGIAPATGTAYRCANIGFTHAATPIVRVAFSSQPRSSSLR